MAQPMILFINNRIIETLYVDFLCLKKNLRNKGLAPKLIYKILDIWKNTKLDMLIFKIDENPLPFDYISKITYYYYYFPPLDITSPSVFPLIEKLHKYNLDEIYQYFNEQVSKYKLYPIFTLDEFQYRFISSLGYTYTTRDGKGKINSFVSFIKVNYIDENGKNVNGIELQFYFGSPKLIHSFLKKINQYNIYDVFILTDNYPTILTELGESTIEKGHHSYLHLYNYHTTLDKRDIIFSL
jgi:hypothetical protein